MKDLEEKFEVVRVDLALVTNSKIELAQKLKDTSATLEDKVKADVVQKRLLEEVKHNAENNEKEFNALKVSYDETLNILTQKKEELASTKTELQAKLWFIISIEQHYKIELTIF